MKRHKKKERKEDRLIFYKPEGGAVARQLLGEALLRRENLRRELVTIVRDVSIIICITRLAHVEVNSVRDSAVHALRVRKLVVETVVDCSKKK